MINNYLCFLFTAFTIATGTQSRMDAITPGWIELTWILRWIKFSKECLAVGYA
jgi:hypothetical protein